MDQIDIIPPFSTSTPASFSGLETAPRLIILVPAVESDHLPVIRRIRELTTNRPFNFLLLGLCKDPMQESNLRRKLINMFALLRDDNAHVDMKVEIGTNWAEIVKRIYQTGDMVVCLAEPRRGWLQKPLSQILQSDLKIPVYILSSAGTERQGLNLLIQAAAWLGSIGIIIGFFILQTYIIQYSKDWLQNILLILSLIPEFQLILFWNSYLG